MKIQFLKVRHLLSVSNSLLPIFYNSIALSYIAKILKMLLKVNTDILAIPHSIEFKIKLSKLHSNLLLYKTFAQNISNVY